MKSGIYLITNVITGKKYIGSSKDAERRKYKHWSSLKRNIHINPHLQNAWTLYGSGTFHFEILAYCSEEDLLYWEDWFINFFDSMNPDKGYNLKSADRKVCSEDTKQKISSALKGKSKPPRSEEHRRNLSAACKGRRGKPQSDYVKAALYNANKGRPLSEEHKALLSANHRGMTGREHSEDTRVRMAKAHIGRKHSNQTKQKISEYNKSVGKRPPSRKGIPMPEEAKAKISATMKARKMRT